MQVESKNSLWYNNIDIKGGEYMTILDISKYNRLNKKDYDDIAKGYKGVTSKK